MAYGDVCHLFILLLIAQDIASPEHFLIFWELQRYPFFGFLFADMVAGHEPLQLGLLADVHKY